MPAWPAMALLLGAAMTVDSNWIRRGTNFLAGVVFCAAAAVVAILVADRNVPTPGDIYNALTSHPGAYTLSLGHMDDLTLESFAYLRLPLYLAAVAFIVGLVGLLRAGSRRAFISATLMMVLFFQAARVALVILDPWLSSRPLAEALLRSPEGKLIVDRHYYACSSVFFYTDRPALLLNGRRLNLEYGSYEPGAPNVFIDDFQMKELWSGSDRYYLVAGHSALPRLSALVGRHKLNVVAQSGGKFVFTNLPLPNSTVLPESDGLLTTPDAAMDRESGDARDHNRDRIQFGSQPASFITPAFRLQTRYILSSSTVLASYLANPSGFPSDRVAPALRSLATSY